MSPTRHHPARTRRGLAVLAVGCLLSALPPAAAGQSSTRELNHAVGRLVWLSIDENFSDDPGRTWRTGQEAIITVRLVRDTSIQAGQDGAETVWIDDGSSFRAQVAWDFAVPYTDGECTVYRNDSYWAQVARVDAVDPATGWVPSSILMRQQDDGQLTWMVTNLSGGPTAAFGTAHGGMDDWCSEGNGLHVVEWDPLTSDAVQVWCPLDSGAAAIGQVDASGTRIDFACREDKSGPSPDGDRYRHIVRLDGYVRLTP